MLHSGLQGLIKIITVYLRLYPKRSLVSATLIFQTIWPTRVPFLDIIRLLSLENVFLNKDNVENNLIVQSWLTDACIICYIFSDKKENSVKLIERIEKLSSACT